MIPRPSDSGNRSFIHQAGLIVTRRRSTNTLAIITPPSTTSEGPGQVAPNTHGR